MVCVSVLMLGTTLELNVKSPRKRDVNIDYQSCSVCKYTMHTEWELGSPMYVCTRGTATGSKATSGGPKDVSQLGKRTECQNIVPLTTSMTSWQTYAGGKIS